MQARFSITQTAALPSFFIFNVMTRQEHPQDLPSTRRGALLSPAIRWAPIPALQGASLAARANSLSDEFCISLLKAWISSNEIFCCWKLL